MTIKKAIITSAGFGTRFLPITKSIQKEMLPILNRPLVDYIVEDCIKAGVEEIIFVISEHNKQLVHFYRENERLKSYLERMGKSEQYAAVAQLHTQAQFQFVKQSDDEIYGTATPVKLAQEYVQNEEAFLVFMGDDCIYNPDGSSEAARMMELFSAADATGLATCISKPDTELHKYGIASTRSENNLTYLTDLIEKPAPGDAPSNLANLSKYIFTPAIFDLLASQQPNAQSGELFITDTIAELARQTEKVVIHQPHGIYLDGGNPLSWLQANLTVALHEKDYAAETRAMLKELL
ncbi:MAG: sugar phosphate nucleotidyltransferase [Patescibacteria group bacterium]